MLYHPASPQCVSCTVFLLKVFCSSKLIYCECYILISEMEFYCFSLWCILKSLTIVDTLHHKLPQTYPCARCLFFWPFARKWMETHCDPSLSSALNIAHLRSVKASYLSVCDTFDPLSLLSAGPCTRRRFVLPSSCGQREAVTLPPFWQAHFEGFRMWWQRARETCAYIVVCVDARLAG